MAKKKKKMFVPKDPKRGGNPHRGKVANSRGRGKSLSSP